MLKRCVAVAIAAAVLVPAFAGAQPAQPSAEAVSLAKRYIEVADLDRQLDAAMGTLAPISARSLIRELDLRPGSSDARAVEILIAEVGIETLRVMRPRFIDQMASSYAAVYTHEELEELVEFYSSPVGRSITAKSPSVAPAPSAATEKFLAEMDLEFEKQLCRRIGCTYDPAAAALGRT